MVAVSFCGPASLGSIFLWLVIGCSVPHYFEIKCHVSVGYLSNFAVVLLTDRQNLFG